MRKNCQDVVGEIRCDRCVRKRIRKMGKELLRNMYENIFSKLFIIELLHGLYGS